METKKQLDQKSQLAREIAELLHEFDRSGKVPARIKEDPPTFLRELYECWHNNGGLEGGRYRNSVRRMRSAWLTGDSLVRSLHAKLVGRVRVTKTDAERLIDLFFSRWMYTGNRKSDDNVTEDGYLPFPSENTIRLRRLVIDVIFPKGTEQLKDGLLLPSKSQDDAQDEELREGRAFLESFIWQSNCLIVLSHQRTVVGPTQSSAMRMFWQQLNDNYKYDQEKKIKHRMIIWMIDAGSCLVEDEEAFLSYYNVSFLATLFRSFSRFSSIEDQSRLGQSPLVQKLWVADKTERERRWQWLCDLGIIMIQNLENEECEGFYTEEERELESLRLKDGNVTAEHILPTFVPPRWSKPLRRFYSADDSEKTGQHTFAVSIKNGQSDRGEDNLRYTAVDNVPGHPEIEEDLAWVAKTMELESPGIDYDEAYRIVYLAAKYKRDNKEKEKIDDESISFAYVRKLGFQILNIEEFLKIF